MVAGNIGTLTFQAGKAELTLEVLHEPIVTLPHRREVKEGERYNFDTDRYNYDEIVQGDPSG